MSTSTRSLIRCANCRCADSMHFDDGCHTAVGFICQCKMTRDDVLADRCPVTIKPGSVVRVVEALVIEEYVPHEPVVAQLATEFLPGAPAKAQRRAGMPVRTMDMIGSGERF